MRNLQNVQIKIDSSFETVCPFPVGYIYQSTNSTSPASIYGGSWTAFTDGRFLRPQGSWNSLGGENTHKLTIAEMPSHNHSIQGNTWIYNQSGSIQIAAGTTARLGQGQPIIDNTGDNTTHNNVPAYRTCYCWYRTA